MEHGFSSNKLLMAELSTGDMIRSPVELSGKSGEILDRFSSNKLLMVDLSTGDTIRTPVELSRESGKMVDPPTKQ